MMLHDQRSYALAGFPGDSKGKASYGFPIDANVKKGSVLDAPEFYDRASKANAATTWSKRLSEAGMTRIKSGVEYLDPEFSKTGKKSEDWRKNLIYIDLTMGVVAGMFDAIESQVPQAEREATPFKEGAAIVLDGLQGKIEGKGVLTTELTENPDLQASMAYLEKLDSDAAKFLWEKISQNAAALQAHEDYLWRKNVTEPMLRAPAGAYTDFFRYLPWIIGGAVLVYAWSLGRSTIPKGGDQ